MLNSHVLRASITTYVLSAALCGIAPAAAQSAAPAQPTLARKLANPPQMPNPDQFKGLSRKVLQYSAAFAQLLRTAKTRALAPADWEPIEGLVDVKTFKRVGVFGSAQAEEIGWAQYKTYLAQFAARASWEGTLRHITEKPGRVILELEERTGGPGAANTVTVYEFNKAGKLHRLDVYVMPLSG